MKWNDAVNFILRADCKNRGYRVSFERAENGVLISDFFPDRDETLIHSEERAWELAEQFARNTKQWAVNIYVVDENFSPVEGYEKRRIKNR